MVMNFQSYTQGLGIAKNTIKMIEKILKNALKDEASGLGKLKINIVTK